MARGLSWFKTAFLVIFSVLFFFSFKVEFSQSEYGVYRAQAASVIHDGDLNIVNQMFENEAAFIVSPTKNYPNHHYDGAAAFLVPAVLYSSTLSEILGLSSCQTPDRLLGVRIFCHDFATKEFFDLLSVGALCLLVSVLAIFQGARYVKMTSGLSSVVLYFLFILGGPTPYYMLLETGTPILISLVFVLYILVTIRKKNPLTESFFAVPLVCMMGVFHPGFFFYFLFFFPGLKDALLRRSLSKRICTSLFLGGVILFLKLVNNYLKSGFLFGDGYSETFKLNFHVLWDLLFSSYRGIVATSPVLYVLACIVFVTMCLKYKKGEDCRLEFLSLFVTTLKVLALGLTYSHGGGVFGARQLIPEYFLLSIISSRNLRSKQMNAFSLTTIYFISVLCVFWTFLTSYSYFGLEQLRAGVLAKDVTYKSYFEDLLMNSHQYLEYFKYIFSPNSVVPKIYFILPFFSLIYIGTLRFVSVRRYMVGTLAVYLLISILNILNNPKNVRELEAKGMFKNSLVINHSQAQLLYENVGSLLERYDYESQRGLERQANQTANEIESYISAAARLEMVSTRELLHHIPELKLESLFKRYCDKLITHCSLRGP